MRLPQMERICPRTADFEIGRIEGGEPDLNYSHKKGKSEEEQNLLLNGINNAELDAFPP